MSTHDHASQGLKLEDYLKKHHYSIEIVRLEPSRGFVVQFREKREDKLDLIHDPVPMQPQPTPELALQVARDHIEGARTGQEESDVPMHWTYAHGKRAVGWAIESGLYEHRLSSKEDAETYADLIARAARDLSLLVKTITDGPEPRIEMELRGIGKMHAHRVVLQYPESV